MADVIKKAKNTFTKGLIMDFSPENTKNEVLTHALNATLLTFNGNELSLQNDMGNGRVETAYLPEGYIPVGTCEYGGILYIVSYNPLEDKSQIGCFPSPERNISSAELGMSNQTLSFDQFQETIPASRSNSASSITGKINHSSQCVILKNDKLNPGDKFIICADSTIYDEAIVDLMAKSNDEFQYKSNPIIALNVVSIEDSGKITYLNSDLITYNKDITDAVDKTTTTYKYHILGDLNKSQIDFDDIDTYRNTLSSGYNVFRSKTSGKLALLAELVMIDSYSVTHKVQPKIREADNTVDSGSFDIIIHTDVSASVPGNNILPNVDIYDVIPKLKYYYLEESQGYIPIVSPQQGEVYKTRGDQQYLRTLFEFDNEGHSIPRSNTFFMGTVLNEIYTPTFDDSWSDEEKQAFSTLDLDKTLEATSRFSFPKPQSYTGRMELCQGDINDLVQNTNIYTLFQEKKYHRIHKSQVYINGEENVKYINFVQNLGARFYRYEPNQNEYTLVESGTTINELQTYYVQHTTYTYTDVERDTTYENETPLYKLTEPAAAIAGDDIINDTTIEKWIQTNVHIYEAIPREELSSITGTIYIRTESGYAEYSSNNFEPDVTYYQYINKYEWKSIQYEVNKEEYERTQIYYFPASTIYREATSEEIEDYWNFDLYPHDDTHALKGAPFALFRRTEAVEYIEATSEDIISYYKGHQSLYTYNAYVDVTDSLWVDYDPLFVVVPQDSFVAYADFVPDPTYNYIKNGDTESYPEYVDADGNVLTFEKDDPLSLYTVADFIPIKSGNIKEASDIIYDDVKLASIKIPLTLVDNKCDLLFKYNYTIVPCMNYGRLDHLAVRNTVDFSKLHNFDQSNFTTWKYRVDGNQLRLTFGADVYDTFETDLVDGLVLEFYDLFGFAGSLEINGKKSYSGIFNKILTLNSLGALSSKRVVGTMGNNSIIGELKDGYCRNINILQPDTTKEEFTLDDKVVIYNPIDGWIFQDGSSVDNDCGTLYSNMIYGVKTYLQRHLGDGTIEFIPKDNFFLYTMPIYNEYFYSKQNFNILGSPKLDFMMTYKLVDDSKKLTYNQVGDIDDGYNTQDSTNVKDYIGGTYNQSNLDLTRYYQYAGKTQVYLEIGLKKEYSDMSLGYNHEINKHFSCKLALCSNESEDKTYSVSSNKGIQEEGSILNYDNNTISTGNLVQFTTHTNNIVVANNFDKYNFLYNNPTNSFDVGYNFIVGYKVHIDDIRPTSVPATTVCALCHKRSDGSYNYEDFGVYEKNSDFLSNAMIFNDGTASEEIVGICRQTATDGTVQDQCSEVMAVPNEAQKITAKNKMNTGTHMQQVLSYIGPLTFCQPHVHGLRGENGVNVYKEGNYYIIGPATSQYEKGNQDDDTNSTNGIVPSDYLFNYPRYNMCLNTKIMMDYQGEFISTIPYEKHSSSIKIPIGFKKVNGNEYEMLYTDNNYQARRYRGVTGSKLAKFNECLVRTMKDVYAYNPDYDSLQISQGDISIENNDVKFISNLLCKESALNFPTGKSLNDYIYLGSVCISKYLNYLQTRSMYNQDSGINTQVPQVQFIPGLDTCGGSDKPALISTLTYTIPTPQDLYDELSWSGSDFFILQKEDGKREIMRGVIDKKVLYGFNDTTKQLIQLDVSNYTINTSSGKLTLNAKTNYGSSYVYLSYTSLNPLVATGNVESTRVIGTGQEQSTAKLSATLTTSEDMVLGDEYSLYYITKPDEKPYLTVAVSCSPGDDQVIYSYNSSVKSITFQHKGQYLRSSILDDIPDLTADILQDLIEGKLINDTDYIVSANKIKTTPSVEQTPDSYTITLTHNNAYEEGTDCVVLYKFTFQTLTMDVYKTLDLSQKHNQVIHVQKTKDYVQATPTIYRVVATYNQSVISMTNITLNDLVYDPKPNGHRLYMKGDCYQYDSSPRASIYYRTLSKDENWRDTIDTSWIAEEDKGDYASTENYNNIYLLTGPSFTV